MRKIFTLKIDNNRIFGLDLLRALAVLFVVFSHGISLMPEKLWKFLNYFYFDGVCVFFVLSGYLIGNILIKTVEQKGFNKRELYNFWMRRWLRTLPNYYLFIIILAVLSKIFIVGWPLRSVIAYPFFLQNLYKVKDYFFGESWSLSVEEWFYLLTPLAIFCLVSILKIKFRLSILIVAFGVICTSLFLRYYFYSNDLLPTMHDYRRVVIMRLDNIMYGVVAAYVSFYYQKFWISNKLIFVFFGILLALLWKFFSYQDFGINTYSFYHTNIFYPLICISVFFVLPYLSELKIKGHSFVSKSITYISLISYSLYLCHYSLILKLIMIEIFPKYFSDVNQLNMIFNNLFYWGMSILMSIIIYKYYELPFLKLRDKLEFKSRT